MEVRSIRQIILMGLLLACSNYDKNLPDIESLPNAICILEEEEQAEVWIGRTAQHYNNAFDLDKQARVRLFKDDVFFESLETLNSYSNYFTDSSMKAGHNYRLEIETGKGEFLFSEQYFPHLPKVELIAYDSIRFYPGRQDTFHYYRVKIAREDMLIENYNVRFVIVPFLGAEGSPDEFFRYYGDYFIEPAIPETYYELNLKEEVVYEFYLPVAVKLQFEFFSNSLYNTILANKEDRSFYYGAFYQQQPVSESDFDGGVGFFGWQESYILDP